MNVNHGSNLAGRLLAIALLLVGPGPVFAADFDIIIRGGTVIDGSGEAGRVADVGISGDRIAAVGDLSDATGASELDAGGQVVAPGFINMLSWAVGSLIEDGRALSDIKQGVTTEIFGEGWSMGPLPKGDDGLALLRDVLGGDFDTVEWNTLGEYLDFLENRGVSTNVASFVGATTLRIHQVGFEDRPPSEEEMARMKALTREAMEEGALGLGSSLIYPPAFFATTEELVELARVVGEYGGMYISHMRSEGNRIEESVRELITIAREGNVPAEIYHLKMGGRHNWDKLPAVVKMIEDARAEGLAITTDMYTYVAGGTSLSAAFPPWASDGGQEALLERLRDPETRARLVAGMRENADDWENLYFGAGPDGVLIMAVEKEGLKHLVGRTIAEIAAERGADPEETVADLVLEADGAIAAMYFLMSEENVREQIKLPWMSFGSDAEALAPEGKQLERGVHPRAYGNFARLLGKYVREEGVIPLEEAIHRLTGLPASNLKLRDRGHLVPGYFADVVVFDPRTVGDRATFESPHQLAVGMTHVFVNGQQVLQDGEHTGALPGRALRGPGYRPGALQSGSRRLDPNEVGAFVEQLVPTLMKNHNSASGTVSVVGDMARFMQAILNGGELDGGRILEPETLREMLTRNFSHDDRLMGMALGFYETELNGHRLVGHGGNTIWFHSNMGIDLENRIAFFHSFTGDGGRVVSSTFGPAFYDTFFPVEDDFPQAPEALQESTAKFAGAYGFWRSNFSTLEKIGGVAGNIMVAPLENGRILLVLGGGAKEYVQVGENLFREADPSVSIRAGCS